MTYPHSSVRHATTRVLNRLTGLLLRAIGYGAGDTAPAALGVGQLRAERARGA